MSNGENWRVEADKKRAAIVATLEEMGLSIESRFVPFSQSRNKDARYQSLNWIVTAKREGREFMTFDYSAGIAHCPSYDAPAPANWHRSVKAWRESVVNFEVENGFRAKFRGFGDFVADKAKPILPDAVDVFYSLVSDSYVLNCASFEDWALEIGYDPDSRKAEETYRACLAIALKLRATIGDSGMAKLVNVYEGF